MQINKNTYNNWMLYLGLEIGQFLKLTGSGVTLALRMKLASRALGEGWPDRRMEQGALLCLNEKPCWASPMQGLTQKL